MATDATSLRWLTDGTTAFAEAACLTLVTGVEVDRALEVIGVDLTTPVPTGVDPLEGMTVAAASLPTGVILVEDNGFQGVRPDVAKALSRKGKAASVFWNVNSHLGLTCARSGKVMAAVTDDQDAADALPPRLARVYARAVAEGGTELDAFLACATAFTGLPVSPGAVAGLGPTRAITRPVLGLYFTTTEVLADPHRATWSDLTHELYLDIRGADAAGQRRVASHAALGVLSRVGLIDRAEVASLREQLETAPEETAQLDPRAAALAQLAEVRSTQVGMHLAINGPDDHYRATEFWGGWYWAMETAKYACASDPLVAALGSARLSMRFVPEAERAGVLATWSRLCRVAD